MLYIPKTGDHLSILIDNEIKDFKDINFDEYFKSMREKLFFKLSEKQNLRKLAKSPYIF